MTDYLTDEQLEEARSRGREEFLQEKVTRLNEALRASDRARFQLESSLRDVQGELEHAKDKLAQCSAQCSVLSDIVLVLASALEDGLPAEAEPVVQEICSE